MKSFRGLVVLAVVCLAALFASSFAVPLPSKPVTNLAFGSCNAHTRDQQIWKGIADANPDIFVWLGDVVYADTPLFPMIAKSTPIPQMRAKFDAQKSSPLYSQLREKTPIVGVWVRKLAFRASFSGDSRTNSNPSLALLSHSSAGAMASFVG